MLNRAARGLRASRLIFLAGFLACSLSPPAVAVVISNNSVSGTIVNTFEDQGTGNVAGFITQSGATYGERFAGQTLVSAGFDTLSGTPSNPLSLLANSSVASNIGILSFNSSLTAYGDLNNAVGEGALSILLSSGTDVFGFNVVGTNGGTLTAQFFGQNGTILGSITAGAITNGFFGFSSTDPIFGVSLTNTDPAGIAYDNFTFNQSSVTVPGPIVGAGIPGLVMAFGGFLAWRRRKAIAA